MCEFDTRTLRAFNVYFINLHYYAYFCLSFLMKIAYPIYMDYWILSPKLQELYVILEPKEQLLWM
jgi:hypothetical protein